MTAQLFGHVRATECKEALAMWKQSSIRANLARNPHGRV